LHSSLWSIRQNLQPPFPKLTSPVNAVDSDGLRCSHPNQISDVFQDMQLADPVLPTVYRRHKRWPSFQSRGAVSRITVLRTCYLWLYSGIFVTILPLRLRGCSLKIKFSIYARCRPDPTRFLDVCAWCSSSSTGLVENRGLARYAPDYLAQPIHLW
jgi:hypothetical protein